MKTEPLIVPMSEFRLILNFMPELDEPTGDSETMTIDWNTLMPVVEKIESLRIDVWTDAFYSMENGVEKFNRQCVIENQAGETIALEQGASSSKIETVYRAVVAFINWYNSQNQ